MESGEFTIEVGGSSRDLPLKETVTVRSTAELPRHYDENSVFMDLAADPRAMAVLKPLLDGMKAMLGGGDGEKSEAAAEAVTDDMSAAMMNYMPLRGLVSFGGGKALADQLKGLIAMLNQK